jgi:hypothetical protein
VSDQLPLNARVEIWAACLPDRPIKDDMLSTVSRLAVHYGIGGAVHDLTMQTVALRSGLQIEAVRKRLFAVPGVTTNG